MADNTTHTLKDRDFRKLLRRWNRHQTLRSEGASVSELSQSRLRLDQARAQVRHAA